METGDGKEIAGMDGQDANFVLGAFGKIAQRYVLTNHVLSMGIDVLWRKRTAYLVAQEKPALILDLATGSGDLAKQVQKTCSEAFVLGIDFSLPMLLEAHKRGLERLIVGDGMCLPIQNGVADVVTVAFGLRNMASWSGAAQEMARVIKPGGALFVLDFSLPRNLLLRHAYLFYLRYVMPKIAGVLTGERRAYEYLCGSIELFPSGESMCRMLELNGFEQATAEPLSMGIATLYVARKSS